MFTGLVESTGQLKAIQRRGADAELQISSTTLPLQDVAIGDSIAVNGVCLTVTRLSSDGFAADASVETLSLTTLGRLKSGQRVNLERAVTPSTRLGGHLVSGHVDGVGQVLQRRDVARAVEFWIAMPEALSRYVANKGSITVDGVSLTVNEVEEHRFRLTIIPHTATATTLDYLAVGDAVNLEVDVIARYLERLMQAERAPSAASSLTLEQLARAGFVK